MNIDSSGHDINISPAGLQELTDLSQQQSDELRRKTARLEEVEGGRPLPGRSMVAPTLGVWEWYNDDI